MLRNFWDRYSQEPKATILKTHSVFLSAVRGCRHVSRAARQEASLTKLCKELRAYRSRMSRGRDLGIRSLLSLFQAETLFYAFECWQICRIVIPSWGFIAEQVELIVGYETVLDRLFTKTFRGLKTICDFKSFVAPYRCGRVFHDFLLSELRIRANGVGDHLS
jgi:hypothetical protein